MEMVKLYGKDYALECLSQSILWYSLAGDLDNASRQSYFFIRQHLPHQDPKDIDSMIALIRPAVLTLKATGRAKEADYIMKKHVINAFHQLRCTSYWVEMCNPTCYAIEILKMEDDQQSDITDLVPLHFTLLFIYMMCPLMFPRSHSFWFRHICRKLTFRKIKHIGYSL
jgi:hypothetical protein